ncbi:MAG: sigma-70 family RNA polymerase sigma factor [Lentisphaerae bacterium]|nr:sigma-70 family RNA polymerase sigma factor [Lentisphaerota bacterium]
MRARLVNTSGKDAKAEKLAAFERLVAEYEAPLLRYAARILRDPNAAQDAVQNAFLRLYHNWSEAWEPSPQLSSWLYRVTHNVAVDHLRRESRLQILHQKEAAERPQDLPPDRGDAFRVSDAAAAAAQALRTLELREQQLVILKIYEEKSYRDISEITGLTVSNVGYILHHAMKKLAQALRTSANPPEREA